MTNLVEADAPSAESRRAAVREKALAELPGLIDHTIDTVLAENTKPSDLIALIGQLSKISGVDQEKKDPYAGLPMINIMIGSDMSVTTGAGPLQVVPEAMPTIDVTDVEVIEPEDLEITDPELSAAFSMAGLGLVDD